MTDSAPAARLKSHPLAPVVQRPALRFSPPAWGKLLFLRARETAEIGAFGISVPTDPLLVTEIRLVRQQCSPLSMTLDDEALADYFDEQIGLGRRPENFARIWIRIHVRDTAAPCHTDEEACLRRFGGGDWMVLCDLGRHGQTFARLRFYAGPGGSLPIPVGIDFRHPFAASAALEWEQEYRDRILTEETF